MGGFPPLDGPYAQMLAVTKATHTFGWEVRVLEGLDHTQAMQAAQVLPILRPWLRG